MQGAIRAGEIEDEFEWEPPSTLISRERIVEVQSEGDIADLDPNLPGMLRSHRYFPDEFRDDPATSIGGGVYRLP